MLYAFSLTAPDGTGTFRSGGLSGMDMFAERKVPQCSCPVMLLAVRRAICTANKLWVSLDHILNFSSVRDILALLRTVWIRSVHLSGVDE